MANIDDVDVIIATASGAECLVRAASVDAALAEWDGEEDRAVTAWVASEEEAEELAAYCGGAYDYR